MSFSKLCFGVWLSFSFWQISDATPLQVEIIRHAEKAPHSTVLNIQGYERAAALAPLFANSSTLKPDAMYAQAADELNSSQRSIQTCTPTAEVLKLPLNTSFHAHDYNALAQSILHDPHLNGKKVLICWAHQEIPQMAAAFGVVPMPPKWSGDVFDQIYVIQFNQQTGAVSSFKILPQQLLYGDRATAQNP